MNPLCIELFCGCFGWSAGWLELGGYSVGFDIEHLPHHGAVPKGADLVLQDVLTLHGRQFKDAALILASPVCTEFSYMAMPWGRSKQIAAALRGEIDRRTGLPAVFPDYYRGSRTIAALRAQFDACFRIQREASEAAGHHIPMIVENVRGAIPWVGRSRWNYGSYHIWGDVPALMPITKSAIKAPGRRFNGDGSNHWDARKVPGFRFDGSGRSFQSASVEGIKCGGDRFNAETPSISRLTSSKSTARKAASAHIAKIPLPLSRHIARVFWPG